jgi:Concanavalin A-like lectin/glucanases superfamily
MSRLVCRGLAVSIAGSAVLGVVALGPAGVAAGSTVAALWHMNETSGTTMVDSSGHGHNGTLHSVTLGASGFSGKAYSFNGTSSYVSVPNSAGLNPGSANITISFYLSTTSLPKSGDYDLVRKGAYPAQNYKVELLPSGQIMCTFQGSSSRHNATGGSGLNNGAWHHIQCIKTASQIQTVIDGTVRATTNATVGSISNTSAADIGAHPGSDWTKGKLDEVSITIG